MRALFTALSFCLSLLITLPIQAAGQTDAERIAKADQLIKEHKLEEGYALIKDLAEQRNPEAQSLVGRYYHKTGKPALGCDWFAKAAEQSLAKATYNLGICYHKGRGRQINLAKSKALYSKAVRDGHLKAKINLGMLELDEGNTDKARALFLSAYEQGYIPALKRVIISYEHEDRGKYLHYLRLSAKNGDMFSWLILSREGEQADKTLASQHLTKEVMACIRQSIKEKTSHRTLCN